MLKDPKLKAERGYVEKDSFVRQDGSEKLVGRDWDKRKAELSERSEHRCEYVRDRGMGPVRCWSTADDPHHIKERWRGRDDRLSNLLAVCRFHHWLLDRRKIGGRKCG